jgi:hypothetical protein
MLALLTTVKWLFITTSLVDVGVLIVTTAKVELGLSSLHVKAIPRLKRICWLHVFEDAADLACRFERDRFEVVELRVVPVHLRYRKDLLSKEERPLLGSLVKNGLKRLGLNLSCRACRWELANLADFLRPKLNPRKRRNQ